MKLHPSSRLLLLSSFHPLMLIFEEKKQKYLPHTQKSLTWISLTPGERLKAPQPIVPPPHTHTHLRVQRNGDRWTEAPRRFQSYTRQRKLEKCNASASASARRRRAAMTKPGEGRFPGAGPRGGRDAVPAGLRVQPSFKVLLPEPRPAEPHTEPGTGPSPRHPVFPASARRLHQV